MPLGRFRCTPAAHELRKAGSNGFGSPDDTVYPLISRYTTGATTATLDIGGLSGGGLPVGDYRFTIFSTPATSIHDLAGLTLDGDGNGIPGGNYVRTFTIQPPQADLNVSVAVDNPKAIEGGTVNFTVTVDNNAGPQSGSGVQVTDLLPAGLTLVSATTQTGAYNSATGVWNIGSLAKGASAVLTLTATVNSGTVNQTITDAASPKPTKSWPATHRSSSPAAPMTRFSPSLATPPPADLIRPSAAVKV
jgi:uncharacterized repeat protein (TIGR01451 family)